MAKTGESVWDTADVFIKTQSKCLSVCYVLGSLNSSVFIDLAQIDE